VLQPYIIPQLPPPHCGPSLAQQVTGRRIQSVTLADHRIWLAVEDYRIPILCPFCGYAMHHTDNDRGLARFQELIGWHIADLTYIPAASRLDLGDSASRLFLDMSIHPQGTTSALSLSIEKHQMISTASYILMDMFNLFLHPLALATMIPKKPRCP
jgi:hypothetical protein